MNHSRSYLIVRAIARVAFWLTATYVVLIAAWWAIVLAWAVAS